MTPAAAKPPAWRRFWLAQGLQLPAVAAVAATAAAWMPAGLWGSLVCCAMTDSGWRWRNRVLVLQAAAWIFLALSLG